MDNLLGTVKRSGYSMRLFQAVVGKVEKQYDYPLHSIDPFNKLKTRNGSTIIVHDPQDRFANFSESKRAAKDIANVKLITAQGQGHGRIMKSKQVLEAFNSISS